MARPNNLLTDRFIKKTDLKPGLYPDGAGLAMQVSAFETKAWVLRYMMAGRARKMGLGPVSVKPNDKLVTLAEARKLATDARNLARQGNDPIEERAARKAAQAAEQVKATTFKECAQGYIAAHQASWKSASMPPNGKPPSRRMPIR